MFKVNSGKSLRLLAKSSFRASKLRNLFAALAIVLTTILFTGLFTIAGSLITSMEESTMRQVGTSSHAGLKYISPEQYDRLSTHPSIKEISYSVVLGVGENPELAKRPTEIRYISDTAGARAHFALPTTGRLPQADDELATDTLVLARLGIPAELGRKVTLSYSLDGRQLTDTFTLVGFWPGDKIMSASYVWLNRSYVEKQLEGHTVLYGEDAIGTIIADFNFASSRNIEANIQKVILESGYSLDEIRYGVNWAYTGGSETPDLGVVLSAVAAVLMISSCGYLMISNVFAISVARDIRYYGLIKTIGTTPRQIRGIIRRQALQLCLVGVPIGLISGYLVGVLLVPTVLSVVNVNVVKISANPLVFLFSGLFAVITVIVSISRPSKTASRISPIEALRTTDNSTGIRKGSKRSKRISLPLMAWGNLTRNKKKALLVTVSLSLGLVILNATYSFANSFDMEGYLSRLIGSDFSMGDVSNYNVHIFYSDQETLSEEFIAQLQALDGIEEISNIYFCEPDVPTDPRLMTLPAKLEASGSSNKHLSRISETLQNSFQLLHIYGLDSGAMERLVVLDGSLDAEKLESGSYIVAGSYIDDGTVKYYEVGDIVHLPNPSGVMREYEVLAIASIPYNISVQHTHPVCPEFFLPSEVFLEQINTKRPMLTTVNAADEAIANIESFLENYCNEVDPAMEYSSRAKLAAEYEGMQRTYKTVGVTLSLLVALVGIMNFINTVITSIIARRRELAVLQSIGMTSKQVVAILVLESFYYILLTLALSLTVGSVISYLVLSAFAAGSSAFGISFTVAPMLLCLPALTVIAIAAPMLSQRSVCKSSVVERLREAE